MKDTVVAGGRHCRRTEGMTNVGTILMNSVSQFKLQIFSFKFINFAIKNELMNRTAVNATIRCFLPALLLSFLFFLIMLEGREEMLLKRLPVIGRNGSVSLPCAWIRAEGDEKSGEAF